MFFIVLAICLIWLGLFCSNDWLKCL